VLLVLLAAAAFGLGYFSTRQKDLSRMEDAAAALGPAFAIPPAPDLADPAVTYPILLAAARRAGVNVILPAAGVGAAGQPVVTQYALLTRRTHLFDSFRLLSGHWLTATQSLGTRSFLSSQTDAGPGQVGRLAVFGGGADVSIRGLRAAFASLPVAGTYYVEAAEPAGAVRFLRLLSAAFAAHGVHVSVQDLLTSPDLSAGVLNGATRVDEGVIVIIVALVTLLLIYRQLYEAKRAGVMKMHGLGAVRVWFEVSGRLIAVVMVACALAAGAAAQLIPDAPGSFTVSVLAAIAETAALMLGASFLTALYISAIRISDSVKNRKDTRGVFVLNTFVRTACSVLLVVSGAGLLVEYNNAMTARARLGDWARTSSYGIFYPTLVGADQLEAQSGQAGPTTAEVFGLYPVLDRQGALFVDSSEYEPATRSGPPPPFRSIQVNPNYLRAYPVASAAGKPVDVPESTSAWVVLVPEAYRSQAAAIREYFGSYRNSALQAEATLFGRPVPPAIAHQGLDVIWIKNQSVFSFNPYVNPARGNMIRDPIITVMTLANSLGTDRANAIGGGVDEALKVRLHGGAQATLKRLRPLLARLKLTSNLPYLITMSQWVSEKILKLRQGVRAIAVAAVAIWAAVLALVAESLALLYERNARRFVVRKLHGLGMWRRYREFLLLFAAVWVLQAAGALAANAAGLSLLATGTATTRAPAVTVLAVTAAVMVAELAISLMVLRSIERRNLTKTLKAEF
jgi:bacteriocin-associated integral membrane protein